MKRERAILSVIVASLLLTTTFISLPFVVRAGLPLWPFGWVEPNSTTGVRAWDAVQNGDVAFYIQNRRDLGTSTDVITMNATGGTKDYFYWNAGFDLNWDATNIGDPGVVIINRESGTGANRAGYVGYTTAPIPDDPPYLFPDCELQKIPTPIMVANGTDYINITWPALPDPLGLIAGYKIYRSTDNSTWTLVNGSTNAPLTNLYSNDTGLAQGIYYYSVKVCFIGYDNDNPVNVNNYQNAYYGEGSAPMATEMPPLTVDYIVLIDQYGTTLERVILNIGGSIEAFAAGYNSSTGLFVEFVEVEWSDNPIGLVSYSPGDATSKIFTAGMTPGEVDIVGENISMIPIVSDNFTIEIQSLTADYIKLTARPDGPELSGVILPIGGSVLAYASGYNTTAGDVYVGLVDVNNWWETAGLGSFDNLTGKSSTFTAGFVDGLTTIWGENLSMTPPVGDDFDVTILPPEPDQIKITDADGNELSTVDLPIGGNVTAYASGYNSTSMAFVRLVEVNWDASPTGLGTFDNLTGTSTTFTAGYAGGSTTITGQNSSLRFPSDDFQINILPPTVDYIILTNSANGAPLETVSIGTTGSVTVYASGYNSTGPTYVGLVEVTWSDNPIGLGVFSTLLGTSTIFTATGTPGTVDIVGQNGSMTPPVYDNFTLVILSITPDYFNITKTQGGPKLVAEDLPVGGSVNVFASAFNTSTGAYWGLVDVNWDQAPVLGTFFQTFGKNTTFTAGLVAGSTTITAENLSMTPTTDDFVVNILPPEVDYIKIMDAPNNGGNVVQTGTYIVWEKDQFYAAGWNRTVGYLYDVVVVWQSTPPGVGTVDSPGTETNFTAQWVTVDSTCTVTATYGTISNQTGLLLVLAPRVDEIVIMDAPDGTGNPIWENYPFMEYSYYSVGETDVLWAAGFNLTTGNYVEDIEVNWSTINIDTFQPDTTNGTVDPGPSKSTTFTANSTHGGALFVVAINMTLAIGNITDMFIVLPPQVDEIKIMDAPDNTGNVVQDATYIVWQVDQFYAAGYNYTAGYIGDVEVDWVSNPPGVGTVDSPGIWTNFTAQEVATDSTCTVTATYQGTISNQTGLLTVLAPKVDEIVIMDAADNTGNPVHYDYPAYPSFTFYNVGDTDEFWAAGFNFSVGYIGDVDVTWITLDMSFQPDTSNGTVEPGPSLSTNFTANSNHGGALWVRAVYTVDIWNLTNILLIIPPTPDEIEIRDAPNRGGNIVTTRDYNIGDSDVFYAAGINYTAGYIGEVEVKWTSDTPGVGTVVLGPSGSTTFNAVGPGTCTVTALNTTYDVSNLTGVLTVTGVPPPTVDYILIRDAPGGGGNEVDTRTYSVYDTDVFYAAAYNTTLDYLYDVVATWESDVTSVGQVDPSGHSTNFTAQRVTVDSTCTVKATYQTLVDSTGTLTVLEPTVDYIEIRDAADAGGSIVTTRTYSVGDIDHFYAAAYNNTVTYLYDVEVTWSCVPTTVGQVDTTPGIQTTGFTAQYVTTTSTCVVTATYSVTISNVTGDLTVLAPRPDYIQIRDAPNDGGNVLDTASFNVGDTAAYYAAGYNLTVGYIGDLSGAEWAITGDVIGTVTTPGSSTTFDATTSGTGRITVSYNGITNESGDLTVIAITNPPPPKPGQPDLEVKGTDKIEISWSASTAPDLDHYIIQRSTSSDGPWENITTVGNDTTSYTDTDLDPDTKYYYRIIAVDDAGGESDPSDWASATTEPKEEFPWILLLIFIIIAIVVILLILFLWRKKKKEEEALPPEVAPGVAPPEVAPLEEAPPEVPEEEYAPTEEFEEYEEGEPTEEYEEYEEGVEEEPEEYEEEEAPPTPPPPPPPP